MGVDGIGKGGPANVGLGTPTEGIDVPSRALGSERAAAAEGTHGVQGTEPLEQLRAGALSLDRYVDLQVTQATAHLKQLMPPDQFELITERLRLELMSEPGLLKLLEQATGQRPPRDT